MSWRNYLTLSKFVLVHFMFQKSHSADAFIMTEKQWISSLKPRMNGNSMLPSSLNNQRTVTAFMTPMSSSSSSSLDDDLKKQLEKAKALLEKTKAKQAKKAAEVAPSSSNTTKIPKAIDTKDEKRNRVVKTKSEGTGLITTDGDLMALLSEDEEWELKSLEDVFENEIEMDDHNGLANRDVAASIFNLRMTLQNEDYKAIFDSRNRFIGEND